MITDELRRFLAQIDTAFLATASADGQPYVQHRGGAKGFIRALDEQRLAFVDMIGNRQYLTAGNLAQNNRVCLFLIDYARRQRVKVWGTATMVGYSETDPELRAQLPVPRKGRPDHVVVITVTRWDINCPQGIPIKLDATDVAAAIARLETRIAELEAENMQLRAA
jgi:predicted pyridoxine 5'-phosphate oxidase superfamily flavin-nucleotide-binding protein